MTHPAVVRPARAEEAAVLAALHLDTAVTAYSSIFPPEAQPPSLEDTVAQWVGWLADPARQAFVADLDGPAGTVIAGPDPEEPARGHVSRLYVRPDLWAGGIGRTLHDRCLASLREMGFGEASLWTLEANDRARRWYERLGWTATGKRKATWEHIDDVQYVITL